MMTISTFVGPSPIEGIGIFAVDPIRSGSIIWTLDERFDLLIEKSEIPKLPDLQRAFIARYGYPHMMHENLIVVEFDHGRFMNHCEHPNTDFRDSHMGFALRDIAAGEELTCNYAEFDPGFVMQPGRSFVAA